MKVHHLNCATMCPRGGRLINGAGGVMSEARLVCHCLVVETGDGLVLIDTGLGLDDLQAPKERLGSGFLAFARPRLDPAETAIRQIEKLGFSVEDVRHLIPTHLDLDHIGGLSDFPRARVHVFEPEHSAAMKRATFLERRRYRPIQWDHGPHWVRYTVQGEPWFGFECVRALEGLPPEILLVPLIGHSRGHCGVAVQTPGGWLLHAGDAYFYHGEMDPLGRRCPPGMDWFQKLAQFDGPARMRNQARLRALAREHVDELQVFCAHDPAELHRQLTG